VRTVFEDNFARGELGAACTVAVEGRTVVDLWGGWADADRTRPWRHDTLVNAYSVGKPFVATQLLQLVAAGEVELDGPTTRWWPELRAGERGATVRDVLSHRAGVPAIRRRLTNDDLWDWHTMTGAVEETEPWWAPGSKHTYHSNTYGFLIVELARRVTGLTPGQWLRESIAVPLGADVTWGLGPQDLSRCADVAWRGALPHDVEWATLRALPDEESMIGLGYFNPPGLSGIGVVKLRNGDARRSRRRTSTRRPGESPASTRRSPPAAGWSEPSCSTRMCWPKPPGSSPRVGAPSSSGR
jgi:CubicO group peptidase (beta-lactamase class C family)